LGAEGIPVTDGQDILLADEPQDFAAAIVRLLRDPDLRQKLGGELSALVQRDYSIDTLERQGRAILAQLGLVPTQPG
jgi:glycosyltransferase involved in cell wall biosynthesis